MTDPETSPFIIFARCKRETGESDLSTQPLVTGASLLTLITAIRWQKSCVEVSATSSQWHGSMLKRGICLRNVYAESDFMLESIR